jgi:hypothetical protein
MKIQNQSKLAINIFRPVLYQYCKICDKRMLTEQDFSQHMNSKLHKKNFKKQTLEEIKKSGGLRKYLINKGFIGKRKTGLHKLKYLLYLNSMSKLLSK